MAIGIFVARGEKKGSIRRVRQTPNPAEGEDRLSRWSLMGIDPDLPEYRQSTRGAFTLLEILLVFGLLAVLLGALAMAIDLHLRVAHLGRQRVEEAQLARVLLQRIADDIRGAVPPESIDVQSLARTLTAVLRESSGNLELSNLASLAGGTLSGSDRSSSGSSTSTSGSTSLGGTSGTGGETEEAEDETEEITLGVPRSVPGLYGGPDWLQVDVSRLPRPEDYDAYLTSQSSLGTDWQWNRLSEVKTVLYGLMIPGSTMSISQTRVSPEGWGLYRDEVDRAVGALASEQNVLDQKVRATGPIAPEVVWLEFWYFDGTEWYDSWDSEAQGGLPVAIEIVLGLDMSRSLSQPETADATLLEEVITEPNTLYRLVVYLPSARATAAEATETESASESERTEATE